MRTILVTGADTGIGKTRVVAALARLLGESGAAVQIVKPVQTGVPDGAAGDAAEALRMSGGTAACATLRSFPEPLSAPAAAAAAGETVDYAVLVAQVLALPPCDWRLCEGAGGIASPIDGEGRDWADFARSVGACATVVVVADRLGAINQARLASLRAASEGLFFGVWLNALERPAAGVAESNRAGLRSAVLPLWAEQDAGAALPRDPLALKALLDSLAHSPVPSPGPQPPANGADWMARFRRDLADRDRRHLRRTVRVTVPRADLLNLADNDYLALARDPAVLRAASDTLASAGASASASPLITGWLEPHERLLRELCRWHGFETGLLWTSGFAANAAVLGTLPRRGDLAFADRLVHHSMIAGLMRSEARIQRYPHLDLDRLERLLGDAGSRPVFVVTEGIFSMDGDHPDLRRIAALKARRPFCWILDEAHSLGWHGPEGAGLAREAGVAESVDILVGTLGKTLGSGGAYTLVHDPDLRDTLANHAGEFIYSTAMPPAAAAAAHAAIGRVRDLAPLQPQWHALSHGFRERLRSSGWTVPQGVSAIVPVRLDAEEAALSLAASLEEEGILAAAVRPPTVPQGTSRLRLSLKRTLTPGALERVAAAMDRWKARR